MMSELDATKSQLAVLTVILFLACDSINPVKVFLHVFPVIKVWEIATACVLIFLYIFISELKEILYFSVKVFFHSILSIFFRDVQVIGVDNIPRHGPMIFTSNHANQFIDAVTIMTTCQHTISYLVAEKSWHRRVIGEIAWAMGAVPVKRAQDSAKAGSGTVVVVEKNTAKIVDESPQDSTKEEDTGVKVYEVRGQGTHFTKEFNKGDKLRLQGLAQGMKVLEITNDSLITAELPDDCILPSTSTTFDILKRVDQSEVYSEVLKKLGSGGSIGIFPEGGSHDRTDLLPLKAGVAIIAYTALEKEGLTVPIVPVGLNYYRAHRFRGRAIVEYGSPTYIDTSTLDGFKKGGAEKRKVCNELLTRVQDGMRSVIVTAPDYQTLQYVYAARRLFQKRGISTEKKQDLNRRFAEGYKRLLTEAKGNPPEEWVDIQNRIIGYHTELEELGIRDYQVPKLAHENYEFDGDTALREMRIPFRIAYIFFVILLALVPSILLNFPVGLIARLRAEQRRKSALSGSKVKIRAFDVVLSEKVSFCIVLVPSLWLFYWLLLVFFTDLDGPAIGLIVCSLPLFSYVGIMATEAGMVQLKDLRPYVMRLFPSTRARLNKLPETRMKLQTDLRQFIKQLGPILGDVYYEKELDWKMFQLKKRGSFDGDDHPSAALHTPSSVKKED